MATRKQDNVLVVLQLSGGNDALNTVIPYADPLYLENRPVVRIDPEKVLPINDQHRVQPGHGAHQGVVGRGESGHHSGHRLSPPEPLALPLHAYLAHL